MEGTTIRRMIFYTLLCLVVLTPLPLGAVYAWSWSLMASIVGVLLVAWSFEIVITKDRSSLGLRSSWFFVLPFTMVAVWAALQSLSLTPAHWHHPLWDSAGVVLGVEAPSSVSLNPYATRSTLLRLLTYGGIFWLALHTCRETQWAQRALYALAIAGMAYATYGLVVWFSDSDTILWVDVSHLDSVHSTFGNRDHYATYAGLTLIVLSGLVLDLIAENLPQSRTVDRRKWFRRLIEITADRGWLLIVGWMVAMTALLLTHSRAGFISAFLGLMVFCLAFGFTRGFKPRHGVATAILLLFLGAGFFVLSGEILGARLLAAPLDTEARLRLYELTLGAIQSAPLLGTGYGTFEEVFRFHHPPDLPGSWAWAHNTYIENALELGVPAALLLFGSIAGISFLCVKGLRKRRMNAAYPCMGIGATAVVAAHSILDFPLQIPAVAATYSFLIGICCAQSWSSQKEPDPW